MVEIFVAYIKGCSAYRIVTPFENVTRVLNCGADRAVLEALRSTSAKEITLITKSTMYQLLRSGVQPRDKVQKSIYGILSDRKVKFLLIDEDSHRELIDLMKSELTKAEDVDNEPVIIRGGGVNEITVAYIKGYSAYRIVTPFENVTKVLNCGADRAVLEALKLTRSNKVTLITKSNMYESLYRGVQPRDEIQKSIYRILRDSRVTFLPIDENSQRELVTFMESKITESEDVDSEPVIQITYDRFGYNDVTKYGFDSNGVHRNGTYFDDKGYGADGFDKDGFNSQGYNRGGFDKYGFSKNSLDSSGYDRDGYNKEGFSKLGFNKEGFDKEGYDKDGFNARGLDRSGFDRQGYNWEGNYFSYVDNYIRSNTNIVIKNKTLIYSQGVKDLFINIDRAKSSFGHGDYVGSLVHLRRGLEELVHTALTFNNISTGDIAELTLFDRLNLVELKNIFSPQELAFYHNLRKEANDNGAHMGAVENKDSTKFYLEEFIKFAHRWIEKNN